MRVLRDPVPAATVANLRGVFPASAHFHTGNPILMSAGPESPHWLQILLDAPAWKLFLYPTALAFLKKLADNAADDLWKNKGKILEILRDSAFSALSDVTFAVAAANEQIGSMGVRVGMPVPDYQWGAQTSLALRSPEDVSVTLARFVVAADKIESVIRQNQEAHPILAGVRVDVDVEGPITVWWVTPSPKQVARFTLRTPDGEFVED